MWLRSFSSEQQKPLLLLLFFLTCSPSLRCTCSAAEQLLATFGLTPGLSHRRGLIHAAVGADVLLAAILTALSFGRALSLPLAVVFPGCWGNRSVLVFGPEKKKNYLMQISCKQLSCITVKSLSSSFKLKTAAPSVSRRSASAGHSCLQP